MPLFALDRLRPNPVKHIPYFMGDEYMENEMGYQTIIESASPWFEQVIETVKRDLKNEHLKIDRDFCRRYFMGKGANLLGTKEMAQAYIKDIAAGNIGLMEFIASRWILKNSDIYHFFDEKLKAHTAEYDKLEKLDDELSNNLVRQSVEQFGSTRTYLFSLFNAVVFPKETFEELRSAALIETKKIKEKESREILERSIEEQQLRKERDFAAMQDRYEKKLAGLQKKYLNDTEALKKQIRALQKKLESLTHVS